MSAAMQYENTRMKSEKTFLSRHLNEQTQSENVSKID